MDKRIAGASWDAEAEQAEAIRRAENFWSFELNTNPPKLRIGCGCLGLLVSAVFVILVVSAIGGRFIF